MGTYHPYSLDRLRRGTLHFLAGKAGSAALSFAAFVLVARLLVPADYAYYVGALAVVEVGLTFASFGLEWVALRYIPEYRVCAPERELKRFVLRLGCLQSAIYLVFGIIMALASGQISALLGIPAARTVLEVYGFYLFVEACSRMLRDQMLSQMLLQGRAQAGLVLRNLAWVGGLLWISHRGAAGVTEVALVELTAATVGLLAALVGLVYAFRPASSSAATVDPNWIPPSREDLWVLARSNYLSYLLTLTYGPQVITFMLSRFAGVEATAAFGFARNLADQAKRYLPGELLYGVVRPALVARYAASRDFEAFNRNNVLLFLISLIVLAPLLVIGIVFGDLLVGVLGHGKFPDSAFFLALLLLALIPFSHRRIIELIANTVSHPSACLRANAYLIGSGPLMALLLLIGQPMWSAVLISLFAEIVFSVLVVRELRKDGLTYRLPWASLQRIALAVILSAASLSLLPIKLAGLDGLLLVSVMTVFVTAGFLWLCKPLNANAQASIRRLLA